MSEADRNKILRKALDLNAIPTLNGVVNKTLNLLNSSNSSLFDILHVIKHDQAITSKVISIANSAYYSRGMKICNLERAMMHIGFDEIKMVMTCILFVDNILRELKLKEKDIYELWSHSLYVACAAKKLAEKIFANDPNTVYTAALLHDMGKVVFYMYNGYEELVAESKNNKKSISLLEKEKYGIDHQEVGSIIATKWRFPEEISYVISTHHKDGVYGKNKDIMTMVKAADNFSLSSDYDGTPESFILIEEKDYINREIENIIELFELRQS